MGRMSEALAAELQHEAISTRKMLKRVPEDAFDWKPHEKSMELGRLAGHIAELPSMAVSILTLDELDFAGYKPYIPASAAELVERFDKHIGDAVGLLNEQADEQLFKPWRMLSGGKVFFEMPRVAFLRSMMMSHMIHHRGQLSVYLRLRDVPLPSVYGPTADEPM